MRRGLTKYDHKTFFSILDKIGWPKISEFGTGSERASIFLLQHSMDSTAYFKYMPLLENACKAGEADWMHFAMLYDRCCIVQNKPQRYGTHSTMVESGMEIMLCEGDINLVNKNREKIGLPLLDTHVKFAEVNK
jgi:hypothetical protein